MTEEGGIDVGRAVQDIAFQWVLVHSQVTRGKVDTKFLMVTGAHDRVGGLSESGVQDLGVVTPRERAIVGIDPGGPTRP